MGLYTKSCTKWFNQVLKLAARSKACTFSFFWNNWLNYSQKLKRAYELKLSYLWLSGSYHPFFQSLIVSYKIADRESIFVTDLHGVLSKNLFQRKIRFGRCQNSNWQNDYMKLKITEIETWLRYFPASSTLTSKRSTIARHTAAEKRFQYRFPRVSDESCFSV